MDEAVEHKRLLRYALLTMAGAALAVVFGLTFGAHSAAADEPDAAASVDSASLAPVTTLLHDAVETTASALDDATGTTAGTTAGTAVGDVVGGVAALGHQAADASRALADTVDRVVEGAGCVADAVVQSAPPVSGLVGEHPVTSLLEPLRSTVGEVVDVVPAVLDPVADALPGTAPSVSATEPPTSSASQASEPAFASVPAARVAGLAPLFDALRPGVTDGSAAQSFPSPPPSPFAPGTAGSAVPSTAVSSGGSGQSASASATIHAYTTVPPTVHASGQSPADAVPDHPRFDSDCTPD